MLAKYGDGVGHFHTYCDKEGVYHWFRLPASEFLLCTFASASAGICSSSATHNDITGICALPWRGSPQLCHVRCWQSYTRVLQIPTLQSLLKCLRFSHFISILRALLTSAFSHLHLLHSGHNVVLVRCSHTHKQVSRVHTKSHVLLICLLPSHTVVCANFSSQRLKLWASRVPTHLLLPSMATQTLSQPLTITSLSTPHLLTIHFSHIVLAEDTSHKFFAQCNKIWSIYRSPTSTGHCFCIRSTTELLLWGVPPDIVKMLGCWKSDIVLPQLSSAFFSAFLWLFRYRECGNWCNGRKNGN